MATKPAAGEKAEVMGNNVAHPRELSAKSPHVLSPFLGRENVNVLLEYAVSNKDEFRQSDVQRNTERVVDKTFRNSMKLPSLGCLEAQFRFRIEEVLPHLFDAMNVAIPKNYWLEIELVHSGEGSFLSKHVDKSSAHGGSQNNRVLTIVYYFNSEPKAYSGGELFFFSFEGSPTAPPTSVITPESDTLVCFEPETPHSVGIVSCESGNFEDGRFSVNCWVHSEPENGI
jgi:SM-20-related protein